MGAAEQFGKMVAGAKKVGVGLWRCGEAIVEFAQTPVGQAILCAVAECLTEKLGEARRVGEDPRGNNNSSRCSAVTRSGRPCRRIALAGHPTCRQHLDAAANASPEQSVQELDQEIQAIINRGYRELAKQRHPDQEGSHEEMVRLNRAAELLRKQHGRS